MNNGKGISLAKGPVAIVGMILLAWGILSFIFGGRGFPVEFPDGSVQGERFLGFDTNGWTNLLSVGAGALLLFGAPLHWGAKFMSLAVGLALGAASVIALVDGNDILGMGAANGPTKLGLGAASAALLVLSLLPRVGKKKPEATSDRPAPRRTESEPRVTAEPQRERLVTEQREPVVERQPVVQPVVERERVSEPQGSSIGRDENRIGERQTGPGQVGGARRVVAPADGDGPEDHGRNPRR